MRACQDGDPQHRRRQMIITMIRKFLSSVGSNIRKFELAFVQYNWSGDQTPDVRRQESSSSEFAEFHQLHQPDAKESVHN